MTAVSAVTLTTPPMWPASLEYNTLASLLGPFNHSARGGGGNPVFCCKLFLMDSVFNEVKLAVRGLMSPWGSAFLLIPGWGTPALPPVSLCTSSHRWEVLKALTRLSHDIKKKHTERKKEL